MLTKAMNTCVCTRCKNKPAKDETIWIGKYPFCKECARPSEVQTAGNEPAVKYEVRVPKTLFRIYDYSQDMPFDNVFNMWADLIINKNGSLTIEKNSITYYAHSIQHNTGRSTIYEDTSFERLPELIKESKDPDAKKYIGMNQTNWREYVSEAVPQRKLSKYPTIRFGKYEWYVLELYDDGSALLLSKKGTHARRWHNSEMKHISWKESELCFWLNTAFVAESFDRTERAALRLFADNTRISLPDEQLVEKYLKNDGALAAKPSLRALNAGAIQAEYRSDRPDLDRYVGNGYYWLKDPHRDNATRNDGYAFALYIRDRGDTSMGNFTQTRFTVRPLIRVDFQKL